MNIKNKVIRLAHQRPDLRPHLLPLLKQGTRVPGRTVYLPVEVASQPPFVPKDAPDLEIWSYTSKHTGKPGAIAFQGKSAKPLWHHTFRSTTEIAKRIQDTVAARKAQLDAKAIERKERLAWKHGLVVGDILYASWGYDQTNVDFYQVIALKGKKMVEVRHIRSKDDPQKQDHVLPVANTFSGPTFRKTPQKGYRGDPNIKIDSSRRAYKWDGGSKYETPAGMGH